MDSWRRRPRSAVVVLEPHHVIELGRGNLDQIDRRLRAQPMAHSRPDAIGLAALEPDLLHLAFHLDGKDDLPLQNKEGLVLSFMVLERKTMAGLQMQDLAGVPIVLGEDELVSPRLANFSHGGNTITRIGSQPWREPLRIFSTSEAPEAASAFSASTRARPESIAERPSLTPATATGVTESSRIWRPTRATIPSGSEAISPQTATGLPKAAPASTTDR